MEQWAPVDVFLHSCGSAAAPVDALELDTSCARRMRANEERTCLLSLCSVRPKCLTVVNSSLLKHPVNRFAHASLARKSAVVSLFVFAALVSPLSVSEQLFCLSMKCLELAAP